MPSRALSFSEYEDIVKKEDQKSQEILNLKPFDLVEVANKIIRKCILNKNLIDIEVTNEELGVEAEAGPITDLSKLMNRMQDYGCFKVTKDFRNLLITRPVFIITDWNIKKMHDFIDTELTKPNQNTNNLSGLNIVDFLEDEGALLFHNKKIIISKNRDTNGYYLLQTIFQDKERLWHYYEIAAHWHDQYKKGSWRRYYYTAYTINEKIAKATTITDFLVADSNTVRINQSYL